MSIPRWSIRELHDGYRSGQFSPTEIVEETLAAINALNPLLRAFISWGGDDPLKAAARVSETLGKGEIAPLAGIPVSVKDLIFTRDFSTTAGSQVPMQPPKAEYDAPLVARLRAAGAIIVGKTNLHEFAYGVTGANAHFGPARNPWAADRVSGGSSSGSAVAVAAGLGVASIGTDTRGSIRIPSTFCGLSGLKPSAGRVPTEGVIPLSPVLDTAGPMARSVDDLAPLFRVLAQVSSDRILSPVTKLRIGLCEYYLRDVDPQVLVHLETAINDWKQWGAELVDVDVPSLERALRASAVIAASEAVEYHKYNLENRGEGFDPSVYARLRLGLEIPGWELVRAMRTRRELRAAFKACFANIDVILGASVPARPPLIGSDFLQLGENQEPIVEHLCRFNSPQNVAGLPALTIPCGYLDDGLPVGLQLIAPWSGDEVLLQLGELFQQRTDWHRRLPPEDVLEMIEQES